MSRHPQLYPWTKEIASRLPALSPSLAGVLALWSLGMVAAKRCGLDSVAVQVAALLGQSFDAARQRLREFYQEAAAKRGAGRKDFDPGVCFAPLLAWVLSFWPDKRLALALDATHLGDRFHVLCVSALYGGVGLPVAWKILVGNQPDAWHPHWCALLGRLQGAVGPDWTVVVLSDRGLESPRLFREIQACGWHPLMRVKRGGQFRPGGWRGWRPMAQFAARPGATFAMAGTAYKGERLAGTLLACWDEKHDEPWLLLTDLPAGAAHPCWYAWRAWIEQGFKVAKSGGLNWQQTRMTQPERAERQFLAIAVTLLWLVAVGAEVERDARIETLGRLPASPAKRVRRTRRTRLFALGAAAVMAALINRGSLPHGRLLPQPWPDPWPHLSITEAEFMKTHDLQL
jgi:hypothetical protein